MTDHVNEEGEGVIIKKYGNRRLYNTETSEYITLDALRTKLIKLEEFRVIDAKTGENLTHLTLVQIILEMELKGYHLLPATLLKQMIRHYSQGHYALFLPILEQIATLSATQLSAWSEYQAQWGFPKDRFTSTGTSAGLTNAGTAGTTMASAGVELMQDLAQTQQQFFLKCLSLLATPNSSEKNAPQ